MYVDIVDLRDFYATGLGQTARRFLVHRLRRLWPDLSGMRREQRVAQKPDDLGPGLALIHL